MLQKAGEGKRFIRVYDQTYAGCPTNLFFSRGLRAVPTNRPRKIYRNSFAFFVWHTLCQTMEGVTPPLFSLRGKSCLKSAIKPSSSNDSARCQYRTTTGKRCRRHLLRRQPPASLLPLIQGERFRGADSHSPDAVVDFGDLPRPNRDPLPAIEPDPTNRPS